MAMLILHRPAGRFMCSRGAGHEVCASDLALASAFEFIVGLGGLGLGVCESSCAVRKSGAQS